MKQDSFFYPLKLVLGFLVVVVVALLFSGCGTTWRVEYDSPQYGNAAVQFALPKKGGYAK
jgi:uncharacterized protein YceK